MLSHAILWFLPKLLKFGLVSLCEGQTSWCQAEPGSCLGSQQSYKEPIEIQLVHEVPYIRHIVKFLDWDGDGDLDFVATYRDDEDYEKSRLRLGFFERQNDAFKMHNLVEEYMETADNGEDALEFEVTDWDGDGEEDLVLAKFVKTTHLNADLFLSWANRTTAMGNGEVRPITMILKKPVDFHMLHMVEVTHFWPEPPGVKIAARWCMRAVDWDLDRDTDLFFQARYFERVDPDTVVERVGDQNPLSNVAIKDLDCTFLHVADEDGDGYLEMVTSGLSQQAEPSSQSDHSFHVPFKYRSSLRYFRRTMDGTFVEQIEHPFQNLWVEHTNPSISIPAADYQKIVFIADWNSDGLPDLLAWGVHQHKGGLVTWYERAQDNTQMAEDHTALYDINVKSCAEIHLFDWNGDGFLDVLTYCRGQFQLYQFDGQNFLEVFGLFDNITSVHNRGFHQSCGIAISDWDGDGDLDVIVASDSDGRVYYHEMMDGLFHEKSSQHSFSNIQLILETTWNQKQAPQPLAADWDNDGDLDLILGAPDYRYFERLDNGSLSEWPREDSPFLSLSVGFEDFFQKRQGAWRLIDCDLDGDLDLVQLVRTYSQGPMSFRICEHTEDHTLRCDNDLLCLGTNMSNFHPEGGRLAKHGPVSGWDFVTKNGQLEILTVHEDKIVHWRAGACSPSDPCHEKGICIRGKASCSCTAGFELADCSGCQQYFYSVDMSWGNPHGCRACPGEGGKVCHDRGRCFDDLAARNVSQMATAAQMARGSGSCLCSEASFYGMDEQGRSTCAEGTCPAGTEEKDGICRSCPAGTYSLAGGICKKCGPGTKSSESSSSCLKCSPGRISQGSGNSVCEECPAGKYEISRQWCNDCPPGSLSPSGSNACTKCPGGFFTAVHGSSMCDSCPSGTYAEEGSSKCVVCPAGTISGGGSGNCSHCAAGYFAKDSMACEACRGGTFSLGGSCRSCPPGHVSGPASAICSSCDGFLIRSTPDPAKQTCHISGLEVVLAGICWMTSAGCCFWFFIGFCGEVPIADISEQGRKVVVTTTIAHQFVKSRKGREVTFHNTRVPDLEKGPWKVSASSSFQLILHVDVDQMENPLDTSMGTLRLKFPRGFLATGFLHCPTICWCLLYLAATVAIMSQLTWSLAVLLCVLGILSGIAAFACRWRNRSPLAKRLRQFLKEWPLQLQSCPRGPERSVTVGKLQDFLQFFDSFIKERCMYYVCDNIVKPLTAPSQLSWAEMVGPSPMEWFVSHYWGMAARHLVEAIRKHAQSAPNWRDTAYWICTFSNSQWHVKAELGDGQWQESSFYKALQSPMCKGTVMIIDEKVWPLQRIWCLFELYHTIRLTSSSHFQGLRLCTSTGVLQEGQAGTDVAMAVASTAADLDTRAAKATSEADRQMIHALIEAMPGGFAAMNSFVRETICHALEASNTHYEKTFKALVAELTASIANNAENKPLPTLLTSVREEHSEGSKKLSKCETEKAPALRAKKCDGEKKA